MGNIMKRKDAYFGLHFDLHPTKEDTLLGRSVTEENIEKLIKRVRPEHVTYDCKGHPGYAGYPSKVGTPSPGIVNDSLDIWRRVTKRYGVLLGIHYSGVIDQLAVKTCPDWSRVDVEGNIDLEATSTFGTYVDELLIPQLKEVVDRYELDSVWLDGECWGAKLDYSVKALELWKQETGYTDAPKDRNGPRWNQWKIFHRRQFEKYLCHWVNELHEFRPALNIASNWAYTTMMPKRIEAGVDFISGDYDPKLSVDRARTEARYMSCLGRPWELLAWGFDMVKDQDECLKLPAHMKQEAGVVLMHGGGFMTYYQPSRSGYIDDTIINTAGQVADFCLPRKEVCFKSVSVPQVVLLHSSETQYDRSDKVFTWWDTPLIELEGGLHALLELHYSTDIMSEFMLEKCLEEYPLVVIPDSYRLTEDFCKLLIGYVNKGGNLLLLGNRCSVYFQTCLGIKFIGKPQNVRTQLISNEGPVSAWGKWQDVEAGNSCILAYRYDSDSSDNRYWYMNNHENDNEADALEKKYKHVAATSTKYGKGKIAAVYGPITELYYNNHHAYMRSFLGEIIDDLFPEPAVRVNAPSCVDISLRKTLAGYLSLHLLNLSNLPVSDRRAFLDNIPGIGEIDIRIKVTKRPERVTWEPTGEELSWEWESGVLTTKVTQLEIHGAVVIQ